MSRAADLAHQLAQARNELNNLRKTIRGLQAEHRKDVSRLKEVLAGTHIPTPTSQPPQTPLQRAVSSDDHLFHQWKPIGHIRSWFRTKNGTPRQGSVSSLTRGVLRLASHTFNNPHHALQGLEDFSHVWILFVFDKNEKGGKAHCRSKVAPPRLGGQRVGVFGTRSPHRPNPLGLTLARLDRVEGDCLHLSGLDILDGTPVLDIKPYILQYDAPPMVASQFTGPTGIKFCTEVEDDGHNSLLNENRLQEGKYSEKPNQGETRSTYEKDEGSSALVNGLMEGKYIHECSENENSPKCIEGESPLTNKSRLILGSDKDMEDLIDKNELKEWKCEQDPTQKETISKFQKQTETVYSDEKYFKATKCQMPDATQKLDSQGMQMELSECVQAYLTTEQSEVDVMGSEMLDVQGVKKIGKSQYEKKGRECQEQKRASEIIHVHGDTEASEKCQDDRKVKEKSVEKEGTVLATESLHKEEEEMSKERGNDSVLMASWISEPPVDSLQVLFNPIAEKQVQNFSHQAKDKEYRLEYLADGEELREAITSVLRQDPRSVYRREKCPSLLYYLSVDTAHITAWFEGSSAEVLRVQPLSTQSHIPLEQASS